MRGFQTFNPQLNDFNPIRYYASTQEDVELALEKSQKAFLSYSKSNPTLRSDLLLQIAKELETEKSTIEAFYCSESGLSKARFEVEFTRTIFQLTSFSDFLLNNWKQLETFTPASHNLPSLRKIPRAIGPVLVMGSSNFPLAYSTIGGDTVAALAAGCPVIVKAHPMHVGTSLEVSNCIVSALRKLNLDEGIFQHLIDDGFEVATQLITDARIQAIGFTGSIRGGRAIMDLASKRKSPIPVFAEMGSANPVVFLENCFEEKINHFAPLFAGSICNDAGQFCTKPGLFFIPKSEKGNELTVRLIAEVIEHSSFYMLHPSIQNRFEQLKKERESIIVNSLVEKRGQLEPLQGRQAILQIDSKEFLAHNQLQEEVFGPFALIISYENRAELMTCIAILEGQLTGTIVGDNIKSSDFEGVIDLLSTKVGRLILNGIPTGVRIDEAMNHGGPYPASSDSRFTAVGTQSITRFLRNITFQNFD
jgi:alpha-ketoglutaric semialdehyde dehydrogenase